MFRKYTPEPSISHALSSLMHVPIFLETIEKRQQARCETVTVSSTTFYSERF